MNLHHPLPLLAVVGMTSLPVLGQSATTEELQSLYQKTQRLQQQLVKQDLYLKALQDRIRQLEQQNAALQAGEDGELQASAKGPAQTLQPASSTERTWIRPLGTTYGISYTPYQKKELIYNGLLAFDSIFLGSVNVDKISSQTLTYTIGHQLGIGERWQAQITLPFVSRATEYESAGSDFSTSQVEFDQVSGGDLGDISLGLSYRVKQQPQDRYGLTWSLGTKLPSGRHPYGIETRQSESGNLTIPLEIATGNGLWGVSTGLAIAKALDPVVLFANVGYNHSFGREFSDISSQPDAQPGYVKTGDSLSLGFGMSYAINQRVSSSLNYSQSLTREAEQGPTKGSRQKLQGSDANVANLGLGFNLGLTNRLSLNSNVAMGLTPDSPDYTIGFKLAVKP